MKLNGKQKTRAIALYLQSTNTKEISIHRLGYLFSTRFIPSIYRLSAVSDERILTATNNLPTSNVYRLSAVLRSKELTTVLRNGTYWVFGTALPRNLVKHE